MNTKTQEEDYLIGYIKSVRSKLYNKDYLANATQEAIRGEYKKLFEAEDKLSGTLKVPTKVTSIKDVWASLKTKPQQAMSNSVKKKFKELKEEIGVLRATVEAVCKHSDKDVDIAYYRDVIDKEKKIYGPVKVRITEQDVKDSIKEGRNIILKVIRDGVDVEVSGYLENEKIDEDGTMTATMRMNRQEKD